MKKISLTLLIITLSYSLPTFAKTSYTTEVKTPEIEIDPGVELESEAKVKLKVEESNL
jgi:predicted S18 family serine protease